MRPFVPDSDIHDHSSQNQNDPVRRGPIARHDGTTRLGSCQLFDVEFDLTSTSSDRLLQKWLLYHVMARPLIALTREKYRLLIIS